MFRHPKILLILLVLLPIVLLGWGGMRLVAFEKSRVEENIRSLLTERLSEVDRMVATELAQLAAEMQDLTAIDSYATKQLREVVRNDPRLFQIFVIDPNDMLVYPTPLGDYTEIERDFMLKTSELIQDRAFQQIEEEESRNQSNRTLNLPATNNYKTGKFAINKGPNVSQTLAPTGRWFVWFWGPGMNLIYWQRRPNGYIVGAALERSRWIADLIAELPDTPLDTDDSSATPSRIQIVESGADVVYKWGNFQAARDAKPAAQYQFDYPLSAWELETYVPMDVMAAGESGKYALLTGLAISALALICLALIIDREYGREMKEAQRRVSFVNQVSHELRTPLTNIRMYAELLETDLDNDPATDEKSQRRLDVILSESQRLSRLIGNVLTFARQERQTLRVCPQQIVPDDVIRGVIESFHPSLNQSEIAVESELSSSQPMSIDPDFIEQILCNLISNVEKYAAEGKQLRIQSQQIGEKVSLTVADRGPGIDRKTANQIFEPFWRASDELNRAAGTGIGLTIVRYLAELHGGSASLKESATGAVFVVELAEVQDGNVS